MVYSIENGYSKKELQILNWCMDLSHSQGLYCRLLNELKDNKEALEYLAEQDFDDIRFCNVYRIIERIKILSVILNYSLTLYK